MMGIAIGGQHFHIFVKSRQNREMGAIEGRLLLRPSAVIVIPASARTYIHVFLPPARGRVFRYC